MNIDPAWFSFIVRNHELEIIQLSAFEHRAENAVKMMKNIIAVSPEQFEGRTGYVSFFDWPPYVPDRERYDLLFCSTRWQDRPSLFLPFPSGNSNGWPEVGIPDGPGLIDEFLSYQSPPLDERIFWIGADTHPSRVELSKLAARHPDAIDAELMSWDRGSSSTVLKSTSRYVSMWDHRKYKYLIDCPGKGYSGRIRWLLATGRPVFIVDRALVEHWHMRMRPWLHYVPVRPDLSDLMVAYKRLQGDPELYRTISENAREFVKNHLARGKEAVHIARAVKQMLSESPREKRENILI